MPQDANAFIWIDLEMSGLDPQADVILEIATIVTDVNLQTVAEGPVIAVHQPDGSPWNSCANTSPRQRLPSAATAFARTAVSSRV